MSAGHRDGHSAHERTLVVYCAGARWDGVPGSDRRLVEHLRRHVDVLWVDPIRGWRPAAPEIRSPALRSLATGLWHLSPMSLPGVTRPLSRWVAQRRLRRQITEAIRAIGGGGAVAVVSNPLVLSRDLPVRHRVLWATDDFVAGSRLMGLSTRHIQRTWARNLADSDVVLAISPALRDAMVGTRAPVGLLPNGCSPERFWPRARPAPEVRLPHPVAGLIGQLSERLDWALLTALADAGVNLLLVGPRDRAVRSDMDALVSRPCVQWVGAQPYQRIPEFAAAMDVGLTPYTDTAFNRGSFPLKTLEYLSAGLPVVSTDLPYASWLDTESIEVATRDRFVAAVQARGHAPGDLASAAQRHEFALRHSWKARAAQLARVIEGLSLEDP